MGELDRSVKINQLADKPNSITLSQLLPTPRGYVPPYLQQQYVLPQHMPPRYMQPQIINPHVAVPNVMVTNQIQKTDGMQCQNCNKNVSNYVLYKRGYFAWFIFILYFIFR